jgi:hypothetical protein
MNAIKGLRLSARSHAQHSSTIVDSLPRNLLRNAEGGHVEDQVDFDLSNFSELFHQSGREHQSVDVVLTPELAEIWLGEFNYKGQRPRSAWNVNQIVQAIKRDRFNSYERITFAVLDGVPHLVDGQHRLAAISLCEKSIPVSVSLQRKGSEAEIEALYSTMDRGKVRNAIDTMGSIGEELGLVKADRNAYAIAVGVIHNDFKPLGTKSTAARSFESRDFELRKERMRAWSKECGIYFGLMNIREVSSQNKELFRRSGVIAVALTTLRACPSAAIAFWSEAMKDDGLRNGDPRKSLINWLRSNPVGAFKEQQVRASIACWNAWYKESTLTKVFVQSEASLKILGTGIDLK